MVEFKKYIPKSILTSIKSVDPNSIIDKVKVKYLNHLKLKRSGPHYLELTAKSYSLSHSNPEKSLSDFFGLSGIYYLTTNFYTSQLTHELLISDEEFDKAIVLNKLNQLLSEYGQPIWDKEIKSIPTLWNIFPEDDKKHFFFTYLHLSPDIINFDPIIHESKKFQLTAIINFRVHLDHSIIIEISARHSRRESIKLSIDNIKNRLNISNTKFQEITHQDIQEFDDNAEQITYERREGLQAVAALTRANRDADTRTDTLRGDLENREFRKENGVIRVNNQKCIVGLTRGRTGKIQIMRSLAPKDQIEVMHKVFRMLGWIS
ncbi:hypothetical protein LCGC14_1553740 [marine sediment metagenome]|uniref:Uncharacterized protein n=1 Tax=marine sediment metagenome TaxID=412755 RepID=A0A0F9LQE1_9ZZZZ